jgi:alkanesulfonate monooxygenase SsuD/methylene tetrahydromethanopterin reductase-like flavin-dependent oxidoreductase (luciferase family)
MKIALTLIPTADWPAVLDAARAADAAGLDAFGTWDHFHSNSPDEALLGGWSLYGALALATTRLHRLPMVINQLSYPLNVLAKETATLAIVSGGRFELGIGTGGWKGEHRLWGRPFPPSATRVAMLAERTTALRRLWTGEPVTFAGEHVQLDGACARPVPPAPPRIVVGARAEPTIRSAATYADEINLDGDPEKLALVREAAAASGRDLAVSLAVYWGEWPSDPEARLHALAERGYDRVTVNLVAPYAERIAQLGAIQRDLTGAAGEGSGA